MVGLSAPVLGAVTFCSDLSADSFAQIESAFIAARSSDPPINELERAELDQLVERSLDDRPLPSLTQQRLLVSVSQLGLLQSARKLLSKSISVDWREQDAEFSMTALFVAAWCGHAPVVRELLRTRASPIEESCLPFGGSGARICTYPLYAAIAGSDFEGGSPRIVRYMGRALEERDFDWRIVRDGANLTGVDYLELAEPKKRTQLKDALSLPSPK
jgi:hypothetical protein